MPSENISTTKERLIMVIIVGYIYHISKINYGNHCGLHIYHISKINYGNHCGLHIYHISKINYGNHCGLHIPYFKD